MHSSELSSERSSHFSIEAGTQGSAGVAVKDSKFHSEARQQDRVKSCVLLSHSPSSRLTMRTVLCGLGTFVSALALTQVPDARFDTTAIRESSALQASRRQPGVFWTLSDSGNPAAIYALARDGRLLGSFEISGAKNNDWEAMALDDQGRLYIGDVGNNANRRRDLEVLVVEEPTVDLEGNHRVGPPPAPLPVVDRLPFHYRDQVQPPDGRIRDFDCEALFWARGKLYLLTKERSSGGTVLYRFDQGATRPFLARVGRFDFGELAGPSGMTATGADASFDGSTLAVLGYRAVFLFERPVEGDDYLRAGPVRTITLSAGVTRQAEGIAWDGDDLVISNEQGSLHRIRSARTSERSAYP